MDDHFDAAVIGAGLAGSSMAVRLAAMGWKTVLLDQGSFPRHKVCGEFLSPEAGEMLAAFGLQRAVQALCPSMIAKARLTAADGAALEIPLPGTALGVSRYDLDQALHQTALEKGADVRTGVKVTSVRHGEQGYVIETEHKHDQKSVLARAAIGAWGRHSRAELAHGAEEKEGAAFVGIKAHLEGGQPQPEPAVELYFFPGGYLGLSPVGYGRLNAAAVLKREIFRGAGLSVRGTLEWAARSNRSLGSRLEGSRVVPGTEAAVAPVHASRKPVAWGQIPHIGDAAAVVPPLCGDGMAMALRSVELCAPLADKFLRGTISASEWRRRYGEALRQQFSGPLRWGKLLQTWLGNPALCSHLLRLGGRLPWLAALLVKATRLEEIKPQ